jgi:LPXTG-motif cell wall-anchored protein
MAVEPTAPGGCPGVSVTRISPRPAPIIRTRAFSRLLLGLFVLLVLGLPTLAPALILDAGDGLGNTTAPEPDPGWENVGQHLGSPSVVYLGNRWILTADHVGASIVTLNGKRYDPVAGTLTRLMNPNDTQADLLLFQIDDDPGLPSLSIAAFPPTPGESVILIAAGSSRGPRLNSQPEGGVLIDGFAWQEDQTKRWGANIIEGEPNFIGQASTNTMAIPMVFDRIESTSGTRQEATAARGDSGGALFARADPTNPDSEWLLSGILFSVGTRTGYPAQSSFYGDVTWAADLSFYRDRILEQVFPESHSAELAPHSAGQGGGPDNTTAVILVGGAVLATLVVYLTRRRRNSLGSAD